MNYKELRIIFFSIVILLISVIWIPFILTNTPSRNSFISLSTSSISNNPNGLTEEASNVLLGEEVNWEISVYNSFDIPKYIQIQVKITEDDPWNVNDPDNILIYEARAILTSKYIFSLPLQFTIPFNNNTENEISEIIVNEKLIPISIESVEGKYHLIIEVFTYNPENESFESGYYVNNENKSVFNLIELSVKNNSI